MPRFFESSIEALLPNPVYLAFLLAVVAIWAARSGAVGEVTRLALVVVAVWAWTLSTPGVSRLGLAHLELRYPKVEIAGLSGSDDIVVLASGSTEIFASKPVVRLDRPAWERIHAGASLWKQAGGKRLFIIGGPRMGSVSPSNEMATIAVALGIPRDAIVVDDRALTTRESFELLEPDTLKLTPGAWLVTSAVHMPRALQSAHKQGLNIRPFPCDYMFTDSPGWREWIPGTISYRLNIELMHEYIGSIYYSLVGRD